MAKHALTRLLVVLLFVPFLGCDSMNSSPPDGEFSVSYEASDGLTDRITDSEDAKTSAFSKASINFEVTDHLAPPNVNASKQRASHLTRNGNRLYVGYKTLGDSYGGGIDIISLSSGFTPPGGSGNPNALVVDDVDIQEVDVRGSGGALYAATAIEPGNDGGLLRAPQFHSIDINANGLPANDVEFDAQDLESPDSQEPARVAKGVTATSNGAFAVSDVNSFYDVDVTGYEIAGIDIVTESGAEFTSVATTSSSTFVLSDNGTIYERTGGFSELTTLQNISSEFGIARLTSRTIGGTDYLFAALGNNGFRVVNANSGVVATDSDGNVWGDEVGAVGVAATDDYLFAATGDGLAIYSIKNTSPLKFRETSPDVASIGALPGGQGFGNGNPTDAQVNHILVDDTGSDLVLYVAKSTDGVYRLEESNSGIY